MSQNPLNYYPPPAAPKSGLTTRGKIALLIIVTCCVVTGGCFACAAFIWNKSVRNSNLNVTAFDATPKQIEGVIAVPDEIWMSYEKSPKAADWVYNLKQVRLFGRVSEVRQDILRGYPQVLFTAKGKRSTGEIVCVFNTSDNVNQERARILKRGDQVEIIGTCVGKKGAMIMILQCSIHPTA